MVVGFLPTPAAMMLRSRYQKGPTHPQRICRVPESFAALHQTAAESRIQEYCARLASPAPPPGRRHQHEIIDALGIVQGLHKFGG